MPGCDRFSTVEPVVATVEGASMAPSLLGEHIEITCQDCGFVIRSEPMLATKKITCPNCGKRDLPHDPTSLRRSAEVQLIRGSRAPRRWQIVGFKLPDQKAAAGVKRVVGLPGESIRIKRGDLFFADGNILRKPLDSQRAMRVHVFDSKFDPETGLANRFLKTTESKWSIDSESGPICFADDSDATQSGIDWMTYQHIRGFAHRGKRDDVFPIEDSYGFNQTTSRDVNVVDDLFVQIDLEFPLPDSLTDSAASFHWRFKRGELTTTFTLAPVDANGNWSFSTNTEGPPEKLKSLKKPLGYVNRVASSDRESEPEYLIVEFSSFDRRLMVVVDGEVIFEQLEDTSIEISDATRGTDTDAAPVFWLGGSASGDLREDDLSQGEHELSKKRSVTVQRLQIWRDVFYLPAADGLSSPHASLDASDDGVIVLGDNSPRSLDSRTWESASLPLEDLIGVLRSME